MQFEPINTTALVECSRNTHTHETNGTQLHAHRQSNPSPEENRPDITALVDWA